MSNITKHKFVSQKPDPVDATKIRPSNWNDEHVFAGGSDGQLLTRLASASDGAAWAALLNLIKGSANRVTISDDGNGTIKITLPQDMHTGASPTFAGATLTGPLAGTSAAFSGALSAAGAAFSGEVRGAGAGQLFRGLHLRTHPDADKAASQIMLPRADEIVMHDGTRVLDWNNLVANLAASGANGLDTGSEAASTWYQVYAIRKSSDGTKGLLLHRAKDWSNNQNQTTENSYWELRYAASQIDLGQSFVPSISGSVPFVDVKTIRWGTPTGSVWWTLEADASGSPSGTPLATSDKIVVDALPTSAAWVRLPFRTPATLTAGTTYWLVGHGDYTLSTSNYVQWCSNSAGGYANGQALRFNGTSWVTGSGHDFCFIIFIERNNTLVSSYLPSGYDQYAMIGWAYNDGSSNLRPFVAHDKRVRIQQTAMVSGLTATFPSRLDLSALIPPIPVSLYPPMVAADDATGGYVFCTGAPDGYGGTATGFQSSVWSVQVSSNDQRSLSHRIVTEAQAAYAHTSAGTKTLYLGAWEW